MADVKRGVLERDVPGIVEITSRSAPWREDDANKCLRNSSRMCQFVKESHTYSALVIFGVVH